MRFKVSMINDQGNRHEETVIASKEEEAKAMLWFYNKLSTVLDTKFIYK